MKLNLLIQEFTPISEFVKKNIENERAQETNLFFPQSPARNCSSRLQAKYKSDLKIFEESSESIQRNILEMRKLQEHYEKILKEYKRN